MAGCGRTLHVWPPSFSGHLLDRPEPSPWWYSAQVRCVGGLSLFLSFAHFWNRLSALRFLLYFVHFSLDSEDVSYKTSFLKYKWK
jgi:hypothetical protein